MATRTGIRVTEKLNQILDSINDDPKLSPKRKKELFYSYYDEYADLIRASRSEF